MKNKTMTGNFLLPLAQVGGNVLPLSVVLCVRLLGRKLLKEITSNKIQSGILLLHFAFLFDL